MPSNVESITSLVALHGLPERLAADAPMRLDTYDGFFLVRAGYVDLFVVPLIDGEPIGARRHVLRVPSGRLVGGLPAMGNAAVIAVGGLETEIEHLRSIEPLYESDFRIEPELTAKSCRGGFRIYEVPIAYYGRSYDEGKKITWRDGFPAVFALVKYRFRDR
jgi:hypothetical protein